jgi:hypothetical protein
VNSDASRCFTADMTCGHKQPIKKTFPLKLLYENTNKVICFLSKGKICENLSTYMFSVLDHLLRIFTNTSLYLFVVVTCLPMPSTLTWAPDTTFPFSSVTRPLTTLLTRPKPVLVHSKQNPRNAIPTVLIQEKRTFFRKTSV